MEKKVFHLSAESAAKLTDKQLSERLFGNDYRVVGSVTEWKKANFQRYDAVRNVLLDDGRITPNIHDRNKAQRAEWDRQAQPRAYSPEELVSKARWTEAVVKEMLANGKKLADLKASDPHSYAEMILAATSYDIPVSKTPEQALAKVRELSAVREVRIEETFQPSREMTDRLGLPADKRLSRDSFNNAICALVQIEDAEKAASITAKAKAIIAEQDTAKAKVVAE